MNLTMLLEMAVHAFGDRLLIGTPADGLTAAELKKAALRGAGLATSEGAEAIVYASAAGPGFPVALFAAAYAGVPMVPLDPGLDPEALQELFAKHPRALAVADLAHSEVLAKHDTVVLSPEHWLAETAQEPDPTATIGETDAPAAIVYTAGATSAQKGVLLRHANLTANVFRTVSVGSADPEEAELIALPPHEVAALAHVIRNVFAGRRTLLVERLAAAEPLEIVRREEVTSALIAPPMLAQIMDAPGDKSAPSLRCVEYGGVPVPATVIQRARATWPGLHFLNEYWLAEAGAAVAQLTHGDYREVSGSPDPFVRARLGSVGCPVPGAQVEIRDARDAVVPPGHRGRIMIRGEQVSGEYAGVGSLLDPNGFLDTGDEGFVDEDGYLFVVGRRDDSILRGGKVVAPTEIESVLRRHPTVVDAAVVGVPDGGSGQRIVAVVVLREGADVESADLCRLVRAHLQPYKTPDEFEFWPQLPRTESGKLVRRKIVAQVRGQRV